ncbi:unnamed protein product [Vitrella brassicaformis CCMP3155]|uniref:PDZ domain-containing protein n=1 Tax=Vitrella brassicaformis (strain CCMP3155) TaxID=1169540 RepID=A0A0G4FT38_VITBC|nr:unnamed protein product [Vitrella brassicaformis CCMP3155]|eukprot:CEM17648.1 unnamed protein product [Vitrella brassicaformis CCMP3155]
MTSISVLLMSLLVVISPAEAVMDAKQSAGFVLFRRPIPPISVPSSANRIAYRRDPKVTVASSTMDLLHALTASVDVKVWVNITTNKRKRGTYGVKCTPDKPLGIVLDRACEEEITSSILKGLDSYAFVYNGTQLAVSDTVAEVLERAGNNAANAITLEVTKAPTKARVNRRRARRRFRGSSVDEGLYEALIDDRGSSVDEALYYALILPEALRGSDAAGEFGIECARPLLMGP